MSQTLADLLEAASHLPADEQRQLAERLLQNAGEPDKHSPEVNQRAAALRTVDELYGSIKGLDRQTLIWLADDEELCGY